MGLLVGKVVLVSGSTQGLGAGIATAAAREGAAVAVMGRNDERGEQVASDLRDSGATAMYAHCDVTDVDQIEAAVAAVAAALGRVDCLVNSAGLTTRGTLLDTTPELFDAHIAVNLRGPFFLMQGVVRRLKDDRRPGTIVNVISSSEHGGQPYLAPYVASKASPVSRATSRTRTAGTASGSTASTSDGRRPRVRTPSSVSSTTPTTAGSPRQERHSRWASSARSTRSRTSSSSCCPTAAES
jgi:NAD(P)-dependent dehydrogenase (short-subunit alcohol dehydrogenase family)